MIPQVTKGLAGPLAILPRRVSSLWHLCPRTCTHLAGPWGRGVGLQSIVELVLLKQSRLRQRLRLWKTQEAEFVHRSHRPSPIGLTGPGWGQERA